MGQVWEIGTAKVALTKERSAFAQFRSAYAKRGIVASERFRAAYANTDSIDDVLEAFGEAVSELTDEELEHAADDLARHQIFDVGREELVAAAEPDLADARNGIKTVEEAYYRIVGRLDESEAQRIARLEESPGIIGGGFGIEGAARGIALAAVANTALGMVQGLANAAERTADKKASKGARDALYTDPNTLKALTEFISVIPIIIGTVTARLLDRKNGDTPQFDIPSADECRRCGALLENILKGRVPQDSLENVLIDAATSNPFDRRVWITWLDKLGDADGSLGKAADEIAAVSLAEVKSSMVQAEASKHLCQTIDNCNAAIDALAALGERIGHPVQKEIDEINALSKELDRKARTFAGVEFETRELAEKARVEEQDRQERTFSGVEYATIDLAKAARTEAQDFAARTYRGEVYDRTFPWWASTSEPCSDRGRSQGSRPDRYTGSGSHVLRNVRFGSKADLQPIAEASSQPRDPSPRAISSARRS